MSRRRCQARNRRCRKVFDLNGLPMPGLIDCHVKSVASIMDVTARPDGLLPERSQKALVL